MIKKYFDARGFKGMPINLLYQNLNVTAVAFRKGSDKSISKTWGYLLYSHMRKVRLIENNQILQ